MPLVRYSSAVVQNSPLVPVLAKSVTAVEVDAALETAVGCPLFGWVPG